MTRLGQTLLTMCMLLPAAAQLQAQGRDFLTSDEADQIRLQRFLMQDVLLQQVRTHEPVLRGPTYLRLCRS